MSCILFLASKSLSRQMLLREARISFTLAVQDADESQCDWGIPLSQLVSSIALYKMNHAVVSSGQQKGDICFVLTADTLSQDTQGVICGKPVDRADAISKIKAARAGSFLCTAFCLDRRVWNGAAWDVEKRIERSIGSRYVFDVPDEWIEVYLEKSPGQNCAGGIAVEGFGSQFLKSVNGSHSAIIGLPLVEVRESLESLGFYPKMVDFPKP